jgi:transcriptional regulator with XRE-family HTH domain
MQNLGLKIKKLRELKNLTQEHVAQVLGLNQSAYSRLETGDTEISFSKIEKIAELFNMKPEEVVSFNEQMVFNIMHNLDGQQNGYVINMISENERKLYENQIESLKEEVKHLKGLLERFMV